MHIAFDCEWQGRKAQMVTLELRRLLMGFGGVTNIGDIEPLTGAAAEPPKPRLSLYCNNKMFGKACGATWQSDVFTECPKCHKRRFVHRANPPWVTEAAAEPEPPAPAA